MTEMTTQPDPPPASGNHWVNLDDLIAWKANYNDGDVGGIMSAIVEYGYNRTVSVWQNNVVMAGNHTMLALRMARRSGYVPVDPDTIDPDTELPSNHFLTRNLYVDAAGKWIVQVSDCSHLNHIKATGYAIADNEYARRAARDESMLLTHLRAIAQDAIERHDDSALLATGYDHNEITLLAAALNDDNEGGGGSGDGDGASGGNEDGAKRATGQPVLRFKVSHECFELWHDIVAGVPESEHAECLEEILQAIDPGVLSWNRE